MNTQQLNTEKFKELLLYISDKNKENPRFGSVVLNKMLYYSDFGWYALTGKSITGDTYIRKDLGPVPKHLLGIREQLINEGMLDKKEVVYFGRNQVRVVPTQTPEPKLLTEPEIQFVDSIIDQIYNLNGQQISEITHRELSWNILSNDEEVPYFTMFLRYVNPIPKDTMTWAKEVVGGVRKRRVAEVG